MSWFDILKVEDIDFDGELGAFGAYSLENIHSTPNQVERKIMHSIMQGKMPEMKDLVEEKIRINHKAIYQYLKRKFEREPKEKEIMEFVIRTIMHESTHAGMGLEQFTMSPQATEYGAIVGQFPENTYYRLKTFLKHPDTRKDIIHPMFQMIGIQTYTSSQQVEEVKLLLAFVDSLTDNILNKKQQEAAREKLTRMEITARTHKKGESLSNIEPTNLKDLLNRYGDKHRSFFEKLYASFKHSNNSIKFSDEELKMVGAVSTTSAPAMFNKVVRGRKKRRKKDE